MGDLKGMDGFSSSDLDLEMPGNPRGGWKILKDSLPKDATHSLPCNPAFAWQL